MGYTIAEKILAEKSGTEARAGSLVVADIDVIMAHDSLGPMALEALGEMGNPPIAHPERICFMNDHLVPAPARTSAQLQKQMRDFARDHGIRMHGFGEGKGGWHRAASCKIGWRQRVSRPRGSQEIQESRDDDAG